MKISCVQMNMLLAKPDENFARAEALVRQAVETEHPDVVLLPETWNAGFAPAVVGADCADQDGERTTRVFSALAKELSVNILAGSVVTKRENALYNTSLVFNRNGACVSSYDKTHLFSPMAEDRYYQKGDHLSRFTLDGAACAVVICYDVRFPELIRTLSLQGLDVLFIVSQWPDSRIPLLHTLAKARAIENQIFVALCNSCGAAKGTQYGGSSAIIDPYGALLAEAAKDESILTAEADLTELPKLRAALPVFSDRRQELYRM